jgi:hypothetical protein
MAGICLEVDKMSKPYTLVCNSKAKKPYVIGHYATLKAAEQALKLYQRKNANSQALMRKHPGQGVEDLFCDLKIIGDE